MKFEEYNEIIFNRLFKMLDKEPSLHDWETEDRQRKEIITEKILESDRDERGCPEYCNDYCWPWAEWPDCKLGREFLTEEERRKEREKIERQADEDE